MSLDVTEALAAERRSDRARLARQQALATLAHCCRPATWVRAALRVRQLAAAVVALRLPARAPRARACCT